MSEACFMQNKICAVIDFEQESNQTELIPLMRHLSTCKDCQSEVQKFKKKLGYIDSFIPNFKMTKKVENDFESKLKRIIRENKTKKLLKFKNFALDITQVLFNKKTLGLAVASILFVLILKEIL